MSAGAISLESAIRTCKVNTGWANKIESDRFLNPNMMVCPIWNGVDQFNREVCPDSYYTKRAGCNSAEDRVAVENAVSRPQYIEYLPLSANGVKGHIYDNTMPHANSVMRNQHLSDIHQVAGNTGNQYGAEIQVSCGSGRRGSPGAYQEAMAQEASASRHGQAMQHGYEAYTRRQNAGF